MDTEHFLMHWFKIFKSFWFHCTDPRSINQDYDCVVTINVKRAKVTVVRKLKHCDLMTNGQVEATFQAF